MVKRLLFENLGWKLFSLALAVALWVTFVASPELMTSISVPIEYQNMPPDLEMTADAPERVYLEVRGPSARLHSFDLSHTAVVLNLAAVHRPGSHTFTIERRNIDLPAGLRLVRAVPGQVRLRFERRVTAEVPVRIRFSHPPPEGYRIGAQQVNPPALKVIGPEDRVKDVGHAETDPIDLSRVVGRAEFQVNTFVRDPQVRLLSSPVVKVTVSLEKTVQGGAKSDGQGAVRD